MIKRNKDKLNINDNKNDFSSKAAFIISNHCMNKQNIDSVLVTQSEGCESNLQS